MRWPPSLCDSSLFPMWMLETKTVFQSGYIYCAVLITNDVMAGVYKLASCEDLKDVGQKLRSVIHHAYMYKAE